ncbi:MAG: S1 RNA-binding domain-containing protein, partial [Patescibacteria group bacterium]
MSEITQPSKMGALLEQHLLEIPEVGDVVIGTVLYVASSSALIDLGGLGTGIVLGKEMRDGLGLEGKLKVGTQVSATLMDFENEDGYIELSIREASYEKSWEDIENKLTSREAVTTKVTDANKGGLMVEINGIAGFLPVSQLSSEHYPRVEDGDKNKILDLLKKLTGQDVIVRILDADRESEKLIVSEKAAQSEKERELINLFQIGDVVEGEVSGVVDFGAFVKFAPKNDGVSKPNHEKLEGLVHISELAWQLIDDPREMIKTGDIVQAKIIGIEETRISLSMKALKEDPWTTVDQKYKIGDMVSGKVDKINHFGAFVYLDEDIHGLAH